MARTSAALFVPGVENLVLSLCGFFAMVALMDQIMPSDFSPSMRSVLLSQLLLVLVTMCAHLAISLLDRSRFVLASSSSSPAAFVPAASTDDADEAARKKLVALISQRTDYRLAMSVGNVYAVAMLSLLLLFSTMFFQSLSAAGLDSATYQRARVVVQEGSPSNQTTYYYASSGRLDWLQAVAGASGWQRQVCTGWCVYVCVYVCRNACQCVCVCACML
jgi:hypothetical protein